MKKQKICSLLSAGVISSTVLVAPLAKPAFALDGIPASNKYTFGSIVGRQAVSGKPVSSEELNSAVNVFVKDKNGTIPENTVITSGQSITSKTGTITWKDSYENVTAFYLKANDGYKITGVSVDGKPGKVENDSENIEVKVNSDLGKDTTYKIEDLPGYDQVFYFTSAGKEAWSKNHTFEINVERTAQPATIEVYDSNLNGAKKEYTTEKLIPYGPVDTKILGFPEDYYIVGGNSVEFDGTPIKVVKRPNSFKNYQYGFTYVSDANADENIKSVNAYWNGNKDNFVPVNLNETVTLNTNANLFAHHKINFIVEVKKGYALTGKLSSGKDLEVNHVASNENSEIYEIGFTRVGHHGHFANPVHETFSLKTSNLPQPLK